MQTNIQLKSDWQEVFTVQQLKDTAKAIGLKNYSKLKKKELIDLIKNSIHNPISNSNPNNNPISNSNPIYLPTIVDYSSIQNVNKTDKKIEKLERELKQLRLKSQRQDEKEEKERLEKERIENEKLQKEEQQREKFRRAIQNHKRRWGEDLSSEDQKIIETIAAMNFYKAHCNTRQEFIDFCKKNNYPVPDINGNF